jgi:FAR-17a/AIG1-like protein
MNVTVLFWTLYYIDRQLVFPTVMDPIYPWWLNHILHTNVFAFILIELFIHYHHYPSRKAELLGISIFSVTYIGWVQVVKIVAGAWVYPILNVLDFHHRIGFFILSATIPIAFYFVGEFLNKELWTKRRLAQDKLHRS